MAKFRVLETSFINGSIREANEVIDFDGVPGPNLEPADHAAFAALDQLPDPEVTNFMDRVRLRAASRGAQPGEVTVCDFDDLLADGKTPMDVATQAASRMGVSLQMPGA